MAEFDIVVAQGPAHVGILIEHVEDSCSNLPEAAARPPCLALVATLRSLVGKSVNLIVKLLAEHDKMMLPSDW